MFIDIAPIPWLIEKNLAYNPYPQYSQPSNKILD